MKKCLVVADDLTGATDTGNQFASRGFPTTVTSYEAGLDACEATVRVVDTDSRFAQPDDAGKRVQRVVSSLSASVTYKKVDSTLRGNLVAEIDATVEAADADLAVVAPAFPENDRTTVGGFHLVGGVPVTYTDVGNDQESPVQSAHLPSLLQGSSHSVTHLPLDVVHDGHDAVKAVFADAVATHEKVLVACDATSSEHLEAIATAGAAINDTTVFVGSGGLAEHIQIGLQESEVLGVVGSVSPTTFAQLGAVDAPVVTLNAAKAITSPNAAVHAAVDELRAALTEERRAVLTAARDTDAVKSTFAAGREAGLSEHAVRNTVTEALGRTVVAVQTDATVAGLLLTGGAVARRVIDALEAQCVRLSGHSIDAGIPVGELVGGQADGLPVVTKAGAFGDEQTIVNGLDFLARYDG